MDQKEFEKQYMARLNAQQKEAVFAVDAPVLLLATPGSGKTTVLVTRLGYMIFSHRFFSRRLESSFSMRRWAKEKSSRKEAGLLPERWL